MNNIIHFYTAPFACFDNFSAHQVVIWGHCFSTAEHAYQWKKYHEAYPVIAEKIMQAPSPWAVKIISDKHKPQQPDNWGEVKITVMKEIIAAKARQHEDVQKALQDSGDLLLAENSPIDSFWGVGSDGRGRNELGRIWMEIREEI